MCKCKLLSGKLELVYIHSRQPSIEHWFLLLISSDRLVSFLSTLEHVTNRILSCHDHVLPSSYGTGTGILHESLYSTGLLIWVSGAAQTLEVNCSNVVTSQDRGGSQFLIWWFVPSSQGPLQPSGGRCAYSWPVVAATGASPPPSPGNDRPRQGRQSNLKEAPQTPGPRGRMIGWANLNFPSNRLTFFASAKEYRSKTDVTRIEKTNTNVACNNCQAKYDDSKCKTTDLLQAMTCIASK